MTPLYAALFVVVLARACRIWLATGTFERLQLTPVYVFSLLTFLLVTLDSAGVGEAWWVAVGSTALMPFAYLGGLLRSHVVHLDAQLRDRLEELRASRARLVQAGDAERRRLERDLHDGAQSRLVGVSMLLRHARVRAQDGSELANLLDRARTSSGRGSTSCASSRTASTPRCSPTTGWSRRWRRSSHARPCRCTSKSRWRSGFRLRWRAPPTSSCPRR